jgi:hypothetical protein
VGDTVGDTVRDSAAAGCATTYPPRHTTRLVLPGFTYTMDDTPDSELQSKATKQLKRRVPADTHCALRARNRNVIIRPPF